MSLPERAEPRAGSFPCVPGSAREARRWVTRVLEGRTSPSTIADATLVTSELVTNAIRHGRLAPDDLLTVTVALEGDAVRVQVQQPTSAGEVLAARDVEAGAGGYGLGLVEGLTDRWGVQVGPPGAVWFELVDRDR